MHLIIALFEKLPFVFLIIPVIGYVPVNHNLITSGVADENVSYD